MSVCVCWGTWCSVVLQSQDFMQCQISCCLCSVLNTFTWKVLSGIYLKPRPPGSPAHPPTYFSYFSPSCTALLLGSSSSVFCFGSVWHITSSFGSPLLWDLISDCFLISILTNRWSSKHNYIANTPSAEPQGLKLRGSCCFLFLCGSFEFLEAVPFRIYPYICF